MSELDHDSDLGTRASTGASTLGASRLDTSGVPSELDDWNAADGPLQKALRYVVLAPLFVAVAALAVLWLQLGLIVAAATLAALTIPLVPWRLRWRWRLGGLVLAAGLALGLGKAALVQTQARLDGLQKRIEAQGAAALSTPDCMGLYAFSVAIAAGWGIAGLPEAAKEHLYLHWEGPRRRVFDGPFPMRSELVRNELTAFVAQRPADGARLGPKKLAAAPSDVPRVRLALGSFALSAVAARSNDTLRLQATAIVDVRHPKKGRLPLLQLGDARLELEEGVLWALQERGYLFPYQAVWSWPL